MSASVGNTTVTTLVSAPTIMDRSRVIVREVIRGMERGVPVSLFLFRIVPLRPDNTDNTFFNLSRNIVALQVERVVARVTTACSTCLATNFSVASYTNMLHKVEPSSTFCNNEICCKTS